MAVWLGALVFLALTNPHAESCFTLCPFANLGFEWCPGCGIGHSMSHALHGNFLASWQSHFFGIPALLILAHRIGIIAYRIYTGFRPSINELIKPKI